MLDLLTDVDIQIVQRHQSAGHVVLAHTEISTTAAAQIASGGTKRIYSAEQACPHSVLCLPNPIDTPQTTRDKWRTTLHEPYNTGLVRSLKIPCLPVEEIVTVQVDQVHFPAILMSDYRHLPLTVLDHKNPKRNNDVRFFRKGSLPTIDTVAEMVHTVVQDCTTAANSNLVLERDSVNLCQQDGHLRLFLNDLGTLEVNPEISEADRNELTRTYVKWAIFALMKSLSEEEYQDQKGFWDIVNDYRNIDLYITGVIQADESRINKE